MVAMTPRIVLQALGLVTSLRAKAADRVRHAALPASQEEPEILSFPVKETPGEESAETAPAEQDIDVIDL